jgi:hypothetical protein
VPLTSEPARAKPEVARKLKPTIATVFTSLLAIVRSSLFNVVDIRFFLIRGDLPRVSVRVMAMAVPRYE